MNKNIKLLICDIDLTLVTTKSREMSEKTRTMLEKLHHNGIYLGIASGRPIDELNKYASKWKLDFDFDYIIGMNGSELWDGVHNKEYEYFKLKKEWIEEIFNVMKPYDATAFIYRNGKVLADKYNETIVRSAATSNKELIIVDQKELYSKDNAKIMFRMSEEQVAKAELYFEHVPSLNYKAFKTQPTLLEFADCRVSKGYALRKLCEMNNFSLSQVVAFGDTSNDNDMLLYSGLGVCMINGSEDTKAIADDITEKTNDEDGLALYIEKHFPKYAARKADGVK